MEYAHTPRPRLHPLVLVLVNGIDIRERGQGTHCRLLLRLTGKEVRRGFGKDKADRDVWVVLKRGNDKR